MGQKFMRLLGPAMSVVLFTVAVWLLRGVLKAHHFKDIAAALAALPAAHIGAALALTVISYLVMTGYDILALRYIQRPLPYLKTGLASFIGYAFSNNIGLSMIAGASVRYRLYSAWGLSTVEITQIVAFCTLTLWLGFFSLAGALFAVDPPIVPPSIHLVFTSLRLLGVLLLAAVAAYLALALTKRSPFKIREWAFRLPSGPLVGVQLAVAALDWLLAAAVLYALIGPGKGLPFGDYLGIYLIAQLAGLISQVPGGLGVFETVMVVFLSARLPTPHIFGALLAYRLLYYWLPLGAAALLLGGQELLQKKARFRAFAGLFGKWVSPVVPQVLGFTAFIGGVILLFSGATPAVDQRLDWLKDALPLPLLEVSHFLASLAGMGLLLLGRGLQRRLDAAYVMAVVLLVVGSVASLAKGFDYEEALALLLILAALLPARKHFYRTTSLFSQHFNVGWIAAVLIVLVCTIWIGLYAYRHVEYNGSLWWQFAFSSHASRFLRATVGAGVLGLFFALGRLLRPARFEQSAPDATQMDAAAAIVGRSPETTANLALLGDKSFLFNTAGNAFIMYGVEGRSWIAMGEPVGPPDEWPDLIWKFRELSDRHGGWTVFYEVGHAHLHLYLDLGLSLLKLGEEARIPLTEFSMDGSRRKALRNTRSKLEKEGCRFEILPPDRVAARMSDLKAISDAWLADKNTREKSFSLGAFREDYLRRLPAAVVFENDRLAAFANLWPGAGQEELSMDLMRFRPDAPHGVMEYLFINMLLWGKQQGYRWFNLGMAPLSGLEDRNLAPLWNRLGAFIFRHGENFYNFQGLRQYKDKFDPVWRPKYLASPGGLALPKILANLAALISGGMKGILAK
jgi:phosphatidylglycerol lysyltransferase